MKPKPSVIEEIHATRREISERFDGDLAAIAADAQRRLEASGRPIWKADSAEAAEPCSKGTDKS